MELRFVKIRSQKEQGNFLPKCNESLWAFKFDFLEKFFPQSGQGKISTAPVCFSFLCPNRDLLEVNSLPQSGQTSLSMLACTSLRLNSKFQTFQILIVSV